ncbi:MAG: Triacylglycerol lipase [Planctomycetes bacterium]|nr:Triacylglycerol lipase [Planctomycetota bacterium]
MSGSLPKLRHPVVLAHGLLGFSQLVVAGIELASYFRGIPERLRKSGTEVHTPAVPPAGSIVRRAAALRDAVRAAAGRGKAHVVAHSMGGLDARQMITHMGMDERVLSLTTLGTPHLGSAIADEIVGRVGDRGRRWALGDAASALAGIGDLATAACRAFDDATPDVPGVVYMAVAGAVDPARVHPLLRVPAQHLADTEGPNDGLVTVRSASRWPGAEVWEADHVDMIGWRRALTGARAQSARDVIVRAGWARLVARLAALE